MGSWGFGMEIHLLASPWVFWLLDILSMCIMQSGFMILGNLDDLRRIWEITAKMTVHGRPDTTLGGGEGENTNENWQRLLDILV